MQMPTRSPAFPVLMLVLRRLLLSTSLLQSLRRLVVLVAERWKAKQGCRKGRGLATENWATNPRDNLQWKADDPSKFARAEAQLAALREPVRVVAKVVVPNLVAPAACAMVV